MTSGDSLLIVAYPFVRSVKRTAVRHRVKFTFLPLNSRILEEICHTYSLVVAADSVIVFRFSTVLESRIMQLYNLSKKVFIVPKIHVR